MRNRSDVSMSMFYEFRVVSEWLSWCVLSAQTLRMASIFERRDPARAGMIDDQTLVYQTCVYQTFVYQTFVYQIFVYQRLVDQTFVSNACITRICIPNIRIPSNTNRIADRGWGVGMRGGEGVVILVTRLISWVAVKATYGHI